LALANIASAQIDEQKIITESVSFQVNLLQEFYNKKTSPLSRKERKRFKGHDFFTIDPDYAVLAQFERIQSPDTILMRTSKDTVKYYITYANILFNLKGTDCKLVVYQSLALRNVEEFKDYLFIPFKDQTSGIESYGGGRYLDIKIPNADEIVLNFNLAYNPYCAYTIGYNCPIPPAINTLPIQVKAGTKVPPVF
jgi:hypothetical protein